MTYTFKPTAEFWWFLLTALVIFLAQQALVFRPEQVTDWRMWAITLGGGAVRALGGAVLHAIVGPSPNVPGVLPAPPPPQG